MHGSERGAEETQAREVSSRNAYWATIYEQYHRQIRAHFARNVACPHDAEDLMQDVFAGLVKQNTIPQNPQAYVWTAARHRLWTYRRRRRTHALAYLDLLPPILSNDPACLSQSDADLDPLRQLEKRELRRTIGAMIDRLSPPLAEVLRLRFVDDLRPKEIAIRTGCSREALKKRLTRAKQSLLGLRAC